MYAEGSLSLIVATARPDTLAHNLLKVMQPRPVRRSDVALLPVAPERHRHTPRHELHKVMVVRVQRPLGQ
jgi:hypothetical protein